MTPEQKIILLDLSEGDIDESEALKRLPDSFPHDTEGIQAALQKTLSGHDPDHLAAVIEWYLLFDNKKILETEFLQLIACPGHRSHQFLVKHLQDDLRYPAAVPVIRKILSEGFAYLSYTCSEDGVIAKWFSHALKAIGSPEAIAVLQDFAKSENPEIREEMQYRLRKMGIAPD